MPKFKVYTAAEVKGKTLQPSDQHAWNQLEDWTRSRLPHIGRGNRCLFSNAIDSGDVAFATFKCTGNSSLDGSQVEADLLKAYKAFFIPLTKQNAAIENKKTLVLAFPNWTSVYQTEAATIMNKTKEFFIDPFFEKKDEVGTLLLHLFPEGEKGTGLPYPITVIRNMVPSDGPLLNSGYCQGNFSQETLRTFARVYVQ